MVEHSDLRSDLSRRLGRSSNSSVFISINFKFRIVMASVAVAVPEPALQMDVDVLSGSQESEQDLYSRLKLLQRQLEFLDIQVCYARIKLQAWYS